MKEKIERIFDTFFGVLFVIGIHMMSASFIAWLIGASGDWLSVLIVGCLLESSAIIYSNIKGGEEHGLFLV